MLLISEELSVDEEGEALLPDSVEVVLESELLMSDMSDPVIFGVSKIEVLLETSSSISKPLTARNDLTDYHTSLFL